jgi:hypothetical protein
VAPKSERFPGSGNCSESPMALALARKTKRVAVRSRGSGRSDAMGYTQLLNKKYQGRPMPTGVCKTRFCRQVGIAFLLQSGSRLAVSPSLGSLWLSLALPSPLGSPSYRTRFDAYVLRPNFLSACGPGLRCQACGTRLHADRISCGLHQPRVIELVSNSLIASGVDPMHSHLTEIGCSILINEAQDTVASEFKSQA